MRLISVRLVFFFCIGFYCNHENDPAAAGIFIRFHENVVGWMHWSFKIRLFWYPTRIRYMQVGCCHQLQIVQIHIVFVLSRKLFNFPIVRYNCSNLIYVSLIVVILTLFRDCIIHKLFTRTWSDKTVILSNSKFSRIFFLQSREVGGFDENSKSKLEVQVGHYQHN